MFCETSLAISISPGDKQVIINYDNYTNMRELMHSSAMP